MRLAVTVAAALGMAVAALPLAAQDSRSLQDMLIAAIRLGDAPAVRSLLIAGADVAKRNGNGKTAIDVAVDLGRFDIADLLVQERRRQRDAALSAPSMTAALPPAESEVLQNSAEAAPEIVTSRVVTLPKPAVPAPAPRFVATPTTAPAQSTQPTAEQLLAVAQQLTAAAHALAAAQRASVPVSTGPVPAQREPQPSRLQQAVDPEFLPRPGRKPEAATGGAQASSRAAEPATGAATTVVVTPRRRSVEDEADRLRRNLESGEDLPVNPAVPQTMPSAAMPQISGPPPSNVVRVQPTRAPTPDREESDNGLIRAVKGIGGFLGMGGETKKAEPGTDPQGGAQSAAPTHQKPGAIRDQLKRDRSNVPHVPARRASDVQTQSSLQPDAQAQPTQQLASQSSSPVPAIPVVPVAEQPLIAHNSASGAPAAARPTQRRAGGLNPFDPDNMPQGSVLPLSDPLSGDTPEIMRPRALAAEAAREERAMAPAQEAALREQLRQSAVPTTQRPSKGQASALPEVPPLPDPAKPASPTAAFERRAPQSAPSAPNRTESAGILRNVASAVGIGPSDDGMPSDLGPDATDVQRLTSNKMPVLSLRPPLTDVQLTLGNSVATDQRPLPRGLAEPDPCIKRSGGALMFCVVPVDWHPRVDPAFSITTYLYQGSRAIARYDGGKATHYHTLFSSLAYDDVVKYLTAKFGPPTDEWKRTIAPFDQPRQPNPTMVWRARDSKTNRVTILEVRRYDDTRNVFPDMEHGAVRLYTAGAQRVFPVVSGMDLMGIDWAARSDHNNSSVDPALANTIRVGR